jgi:hypothetical protein
MRLVQRHAGQHTRQRVCTVAATHAVVFAVVLYFTQKMVWRASMMMTMPSREGLEEQKKQR